MDNLNIRKENVHKTLSKKNKLIKRTVIAALIMFGVTAPFLKNKLDKDFENVPINATRAEEVNEQMMAVYGTTLEEINQQIKNGKDVITNFCLASNAYSVNDSIENRQAYVSEAKQLANTSTQMVMQKMMAATGEEEMSSPMFTDNSVDGKTNEVFISGASGTTYQIPTEYSSLLHSAKDILSYQGDGSSDAWKDEMGTFSDTANQLLTETVDMSQQQIISQNGKLTVQPISAQTMENTIER